MMFALFVLSFTALMIVLILILVALNDTAPADRPEILRALAEVLKVWPPRR